MSWQQLIDIYNQAVDERRQAATEPPLACPNDGEPLEDAGDGVLHCPWDGWCYPDDWAPVS